MTLLPCIYCRRTEVPRTKEHVLQHSLGASATLPTEVCEDCNSAFSPIDKYFVEALPFYYTGGNKMLRGLGLGRMALEDGVSVNVLYRSGGAAFPPQLIRTPGANWRYVGSEGKDYDAMARELRNPADIAIEPMVVPHDDGVPELSIVRSSPNKYIVQGWDDESLSRTCEGLRINGLQLTRAEHQSEGPEEVAGTACFPTGLNVAPFCRAMVKVALNFICYRLGADTALRPEFDGLRNFARNGVGTWNDYVSVMMPHSRVQNTEAVFLSSKHHGLTLFRGFHSGGKDVVSVVIAGRTVGRVRVNQIKELPTEKWLLTRFDPVRHKVEDYELPKDIAQAVLSPDEAGPA